MRYFVVTAYNKAFQTDYEATNKPVSSLVVSLSLACAKTNSDSV